MTLDPYFRKFLPSNSELATLITQKDWGKTALGPPSNWSQALRSTVSVCLRSRLCACVYWGPDFHVIYNDAYKTILGTKHPWALARPAGEVWSEMFHIIGPLLQDTFKKGVTTGADDKAIFLDRFGYIEEFYCSFSYAPIINESGKTEAVFAVLPETSKRVIGERRLQTLHHLGDVGDTMNGVAETLDLIANTLEENPYDIPFAAFYLWDDQRTEARLCTTIGIEKGTELTPLSISTARLAAIMELAERSRETDIDVFDISADIGTVFPGPWQASLSAAVRVPFGVAEARGPTGFMLAGVNPYKKVDRDYLIFYNMVGDHISTLITTAFIREQESARIKALAELDNAKTTFFSNVSHELRTPLTLISGPLDDLLTGKVGSLTREQCTNLDLAQRNCLRLLNLVNDLLEFTRIEAGYSIAIFEPVALDRMTAELARTFERAAEGKGIKLRIDCATLSKPVYVDPEMWEKIVLNLLSNAFKYTPTGAVEITLRECNDWACLSVKDTGFGIPEHQLPRVFDRFHRVDDGAGRHLEGTGIGLALVKELTDQHSGKVRAESKEGEGSIFTIEIPLGAQHLPRDRVQPPSERQRSGLARRYHMEAVPGAEAPLTSEAKGAAPGSGRGASATSGTKRVLLVDDNADMQHYIGQVLSERFIVDVASSGLEALEMIAVDAPAVVITDVMMPEIDGISLLAELRSNPATCTIPIMLLTADAGEESKLKALAQGADDYVVKPFHARELLARAEGSINLAGLRARVAQQAERILLARDLHDTLMQSLQGAILLLESGEKHMSSDRELDRARTLVSQTRSALQQAMQQGRDELLLLRSVGSEERELRDAIERLKAEFSSERAVAFKVREVGKQKDLKPAAWPEIYGICREAVSNAARHSQATKIEIELCYGETFGLSVADNGSGMDSELLRVGRPGHFGIQGMRERAKGLKGRLDVESEPGSGTRINLTVPGRYLYEELRDIE